MSVRDLTIRVRGEYLEMPGLRLTLRQASRLWNVERSLCERVVRELVQMGFLKELLDGSYVAADTCEWSRSAAV